MTGKWQGFFDKGGISGAILTDFSKVFGCILHDVLKLLPMVLTTNLPESWRVFFPIGNKEQTLIIASVDTRTL